MYYEIKDNNKKEWIVLLHCICANMHIFDAYLDKLSERYNILSIDLPGHGESREYSDKIGFKEVAEKIIKITEENNIDKFAIWGISLGSVVAKYILQMVPQKIDKIVFESPAFYIENKVYLSMFRLFNKVKYIIPKTIYLKSFIYAVIPGKNRKYMRKDMYDMLRKSNYNILSIWLGLLNNEYKCKNFDTLNNSNIDKYYILGDKDYIFKNGTINNIKENEYNKVIIEKNCGHLCHLETTISI